jgi:hypothetical protein
MTQEKGEQNKMKRSIVLAVVALIAALSLRAQEDETKVLQIQTMAGVVAPYTGLTNPIRGVAGAGAPWVVRSVNGKLRTNGDLQLQVRGLVLTSTGLNPAPVFRATVSCQTIDGAGAASVINVSTDSFPATTAGDAFINSNVELPTPCIAPIVFVTLANGRWIAATGF